VAENQPLESLAVVDFGSLKTSLRKRWSKIIQQTRICGRFSTILHEACSEGSESEVREDACSESNRYPRAIWDFTKPHRHKAKELDALWTY
jgi:hypothetical protein